MKVIVTGGCGFIGSNICVFLKNLSFDVISVDNCSKTYSKLNLKRLDSFNIKNYNIDISNENKFIKFNPYLDLIEGRLINLKSTKVLVVRDFRLLQYMLKENVKLFSISFQIGSEKRM